jgi:hypothetical protein
MVLSSTLTVIHKEFCEDSQEIFSGYEREISRKKKGGNTWKAKVQTFRASMKSFSSVKGDPGAPTGLTRWQRQYSAAMETKGREVRANPPSKKRRW